MWSRSLVTPGPRRLPGGRSGCQEQTKCVCGFLGGRGINVGATLRQILAAINTKAAHLWFRGHDEPPFGSGQKTVHRGNSGAKIALLLSPKSRSIPPIFGDPETRTSSRPNDRYTRSGSYLHRGL